MNKAFEKILENIENLKLPFPDKCPSYYGNTNKLLDATKEIVQEVAEEFAADTNVGNNGWIPCDVKMPEERDSIFAQFKGTDKWKNSMFERMSEFVNATVEFEDGTRMVKTLHTVDGKWHMGSGFLKYKVIAWKPLPAPFREIEVSE